MTARPTEPLVRAHEMGLYKRYFDLIATGRKTTEVRPRAGRLGQPARHARGPAANIRQIYPPEREALGVVGIELVDPQTRRVREFSDDVGGEPGGDSAD